MAIGIGIGLSIPRDITGDAGVPTPFFEILAENLIVETFSIFYLQF